MKNFGKQAE